MTALIYIIGIILTIGFVALVGTITVTRLELAKAKKQVIEPKHAFPQAGICQCDDALCFHADGPCSVKNCPCKAFVPSGITDDDLNIIASGTVFRLMSTASEAKKRWELAEADAEKRAISGRRDYY